MENPLYKWLFSTAMLVYQRVQEMGFCTSILQQSTLVHPVNYPVFGPKKPLDRLGPLLQSGVNLSRPRAPGLYVL